MNAVYEGPETSIPGPEQHASQLANQNTKIIRFETNIPVHLAYRDATVCKCEVRELGAARSTIRWHVKQDQNPIPAPKNESSPVSVSNSGRPVALLKMPMDRAVVAAVKMVQAAMVETGEQWSDDSRQDLASTVLIQMAREGWIGAPGKVA